MYKFFHVISDKIKYKQCKEVGVKQVLISYYYLQKDEVLYDLLINDREIEIIVDSGLYSFANSVTIDIETAKKYSKKYIDFVKENHHKKMFVGFFELDFDLIEYDYQTFVKPIQKELLDITKKIILITQKGRNVDDIIQMLNENVDTIAIPFASEVERSYFDVDYLISLIKKYNKKLHLLGCSTENYLIKANQSDSSSWFMSAAFGSETRIINGKVKTFHYDDDSTVDKDYNSRALKNALAYITLEEEINKKIKNKYYEVQSLF